MHLAHRHSVYEKKTQNFITITRARGNDSRLAAAAAGQEETVQLYNYESPVYLESTLSQTRRARKRIRTRNDG